MEGTIMINGIDSSWPQGASTAFTAGAQFVIVGSSTGDYAGKLLAFDSTPPQIDRARKQGLKVGHYFYNGGSPTTGAEFFVKHLHDFQPDDDVLALDLEGAALWSPSQALTWLEHVVALTGIPRSRVLVYMNRSVNYGADWGAVAKSYPLWYARPDGDSNDQKHWDSWAVRQTGIEGSIDQDVATPAFFAAWGSGSESAGKPSKPAKPPAPVSKRPDVAPKTPPRYPLPAGSYFGPEGGPVQSVSGWHGHKSGVKRIQRQLSARGYDLAVDGYYSHRGDTRPQQSRTGSVVIAFQKDKGLTPDGLCGPVTWNAAWTEPVT